MPVRVLPVHIADFGRYYDGAFAKNRGIGRARRQVAIARLSHRFARYRHDRRRDIGRRAVSFRTLRHRAYLRRTRPPPPQDNDTRSCQYHFLHHRKRLVLGNETIRRVLAYRAHRRNTAYTVHVAPRVGSGVRNKRSYGYRARFHGKRRYRRIDNFPYFHQKRRKIP